MFLGLFRILNLTTRLMFNPTAKSLCHAANTLINYKSLTKQYSKTIFCMRAIYNIIKQTKNN